MLILHGDAIGPLVFDGNADRAVRHGPGFAGQGEGGRQNPLPIQDQQHLAVLDGHVFGIAAQGSHPGTVVQRHRKAGPGTPRHPGLDGGVGVRLPQKRPFRHIVALGVQIARKLPLIQKRIEPPAIAMQDLQQAIPIPQAGKGLLIAQPVHILQQGVRGIGDLPDLQRLYLRQPQPHVFGRNGEGGLDAAVLKAVMAVALPLAAQGQEIQVIFSGLFDQQGHEPLHISLAPGLGMGGHGADIARFEGVVPVDPQGLRQQGDGGPDAAILHSDCVQRAKARMSVHLGQQDLKIMGHPNLAEHQIDKIQELFFLLGPRHPDLRHGLDPPFSVDSHSIPLIPRIDKPIFSLYDRNVLKKFTLFGGDSRCMYGV